MMLCSIIAIRRCILAGVKFLSRLFTALNLLPSTSTLCRYRNAALVGGEVLLSDGARVRIELGSQALRSNRFKISESGAACAKRWIFASQRVTRNHPLDAPSCPECSGGRKEFHILRALRAKLR
jgi:hypothetical protein